MTLIDAIGDPELFARFFKKRETWATWLVVLKAIFGLPLLPEDMALFQRCTGRTVPFEGPVTEGWLVCGRRSGKSYIAALIAVFLATFRNYTPFLSPGERGVVAVLAVDRDQARVIFRYIQAFIDEVPMLAAMVTGRTAESLDLSNRITIEVSTSSFRSIRGRTIVAALCDEAAYWRSDESRNPAAEVLAAIRPAMATIPNALLLCLSSPYDRTGPLYEAVERYYGNDAADVLVWRAPTKVMNPTIRDSVITRAFEQDPQAAAAEWDAEFRSDISSFLEEAWISSAIASGCFERPPQKSRTHTAFVDPSGGKADSFTLAIAHREDDVSVQDVLREFRPPFDPASVVREIAGILKPYGLRGVTGDAYSGEWVQSAFRKEGIAYVLAGKSRSEIYLETGPLLAQGRVRLLDSQRQTAQLRQLERRTAPGGRDRVNHPPGGHDDLANAGMGAVWLTLKRSETAVQTVVQTVPEWEPFTVLKGMRQGPPSKLPTFTNKDRARWIRSQLEAAQADLAAARVRVDAGLSKPRAVSRVEFRIKNLLAKLKTLEATA